MNDNIVDVLFDLCLKAQSNAYAPYSKYQVGACLITKDNKAYLGSNVENKAYGSTICAERACLVSSIANGVKKDDIIFFGLLNPTNEIEYPCGACLQVMDELLPDNVKIYLFNKNKDYLLVKMSDLLPKTFKGINNV